MPVPDIYVAALASLVFAVGLRLYLHVLLRDGLAIAGTVFLLYLLISALT